MAKPELGTKRVCPVTGRKFYDLNKDPIISPFTGQVVTIAAPVIAGRARPETASKQSAQADDREAEADDVELVSLEDADENASGAKSPPAADDIEDDEVIEDDEQDAFLEDEEDGDDDVADLIDGDIDGDEEA